MVSITGDAPAFCPKMLMLLATGVAVPESPVKLVGTAAVALIVAAPPKETGEPVIVIPVPAVSVMELLVRDALPTVPKIGSLLGPLPKSTVFTAAGAIEVMPLFIAPTRTEWLVRVVALKVVTPSKVTMPGNFMLRLLAGVDILNLYYVK
jgi:hypothetical protein